MNKTIGFVALNIEDNEQSKLILDSIDRLSKAAPYLDHILFNTYYFTNLSSSFGSFATLHINEAKYFKGPLVCFTLKDMEFVSGCISNQKIFIANSAEWVPYTSDPNRDPMNQHLSRYDELRKLYVSENNLLCTNSSEIKGLLDICWKNSVLLSPIESIYEYIKL